MIQKITTHEVTSACKHVFCLCSGLSKDATQLCVNWMAPFVESVGRFSRATLRDFIGIKTEDRHNVQTHTNYMTMLVSIKKKNTVVHTVISFLRKVKGNKDDFKAYTIIICHWHAVKAS